MAEASTVAAANAAMARVALILTKAEFCNHSFKDQRQTVNVSDNRKECRNWACASFIWTCRLHLPRFYCITCTKDPSTSTLTRNTEIQRH